MGKLKTFTTVAAAAALILGSALARAEQDYGDSLSTAPSAEAMAFDLVLVRPLSAAATVLGVGLFVVQLPFALLTGNLHDPAERLVVQPAKFTFTRELGTYD